MWRAGSPMSIPDSGPAMRFMPRLSRSMGWREFAVSIGTSVEFRVCGEWNRVVPDLSGDERNLRNVRLSRFSPVFPSVFPSHSSLGYRTPNEFAEILKSSVMAG
jgi:hypothetical protein